MSGRMLVGYATRTDSTKEVAEAIGDVLSERGYSVDVKALKDQPSVRGYDAVVLGSAVNGGAWLPEAVGFIESHRTELQSLPVSVFCVHIMNLGDEPKQRAKRLAYLNPIRKLIRPQSEAFFAGKGPSSEDTSLIMRWAFRAFGGGGEGDCRDWSAIRRWAQGLPGNAPS